MKTLRELAERWREEADGNRSPGERGTPAEVAVQLDCAAELESALDATTNPAEVSSKLAETPETDAAQYDSQPGNPMIPEGSWVVKVAFARRLERERDEARRHAQFWRNIHCDDCDTADKNLFPWEK